MRQFSGKNILVIGGTKGIGLAISNQLQQANAQVIIAARNPPAKINNSHFISWDALQNDTSPLLEVPKQLHGMVYCPGSINLKPFQRLSTEDFTRDFDLNVLGAIRALQVLQKNLKASQGSSVVLFSTVAANIGMNFHASVATSKAALEGLARALAAEWAASQVRLNIIAPSLTDTSLSATLLNTPEKREAAGKRHPLGRVGTPEEIAAMAVFLLSADSGWLTGQTIGLDGGFSTLRV